MSRPADLRPAGLRTALAGITLLVLALAAIFPAARAEAAKPKLGFVKVAEAKQPTTLSSPPGFPDLTFVTERAGKLRVMRQGRFLKKPLLDITRLIDPTRIERGLLGLAYAPDFRTTGRFFLDYTEKSGDSIVVEYRTVPGHPLKLRKNSRRVVLSIPRVNDNGNHNGGHLAFLDGLLYVSVGDGFDPGDAPNNAQNLESLRGKLLRIDPRPDSSTGLGYRIPPGNPFVGVPGRDEIFSYGLRNPYSFSFFRSGNRQMIAIGDVGQGRYEELNVLPLARARGGNFGWKSFEGFEPFNCGELCPNGADPTVSEGLIWPQLVYSHEEGCAIITGPVVRSKALSSIRGRLIYGDFCQNRIRTAVPHEPTILDDRPAGFFLPPGRNKVILLNGFGTDGHGRLHAFSHFGGIYRIVQR